MPRALAAHARADVQVREATGWQDCGNHGRQRGNRLRNGQGHVQEGRSRRHPLQGQKQNKPNPNRCHHPA